MIQIVKVIHHLEMNEIKFVPVKINKSDTCLTYVLKRIGKFIQSEIYSLENYTDYFEREKIGDKSELMIGDIILWNEKLYYQDFPIEITESGIILSHPVQRNIHVAIIERIEDDKILFSECTRTKMENGGVSILTYRDLNTIRIPDFKLTLKQLNND